MADHVLPPLGEPHEPVAAQAISGQARSGIRMTLQARLTLSSVLVRMRVTPLPR